MGLYVDKNHLYSCGEIVDGHECGAKVIMTKTSKPIEGQDEAGAPKTVMRDIPTFKRTCDHADGKIYANIAARCRGKGGMMSNAEHFIKHTVVAKLLSKLMGRSIVWQ